MTSDGISVWRMRVMACEGQPHGRQEARLAQENARRKKLVGERTLERNKSDELWG
jgi:hypothetical protein